LHDHYSLYGEHQGMRTARKHIGWAVQNLPGGPEFRAHMNTLESSSAQVQAMDQWFATLAAQYEYLPFIKTTML
jgi:tRNA-dihydrouridine synthase B